MIVIGLLAAVAAWRIRHGLGAVAHGRSGERTDGLDSCR
jgi:hypothetical protein